MWQAFRRFKKDECSSTRGMLSDYMDRRLNPEQLTQVEEHLLTCEGCRKELESLRATVALLHRLPEAMASRSFAVVPVAPVPGRRALRALRFATAGAALLLVLAFAADRTDLFHQNPLSTQYSGTSTLDFGSAKTSEEGESHWVVSGVKSSVDPVTESVENTTVSLVVPDGTDNVVMAVNSLAQANDGVLLADVVAGSSEAPQLVLTGSGNEPGLRGDAKAYAVVYSSDNEASTFATNDTTILADKLAWYSAQVGQDGSHLNLLNSDNTELYSFDLSAAQKEFKAGPDRDWLRYLEYGLIGLVAVLGGTTLALWFRQRRRKAAGVS